jgi:5-methylthioadenosine/S-adenosylhomocysteine deaminase
MNSLIRNATLVSAGPRRGVVDDGYLRIVDGRIAEVGQGPVTAAPDEAVIEGYGRVVFPGLINTHAHLFQSLLKGLGADKQLYDWLSTTIAPCADELGEEDCYLGALLGCLEGIKSGTTTFVDFMYPHPRPHLSDAVIQGFRQVGVRGILARGICDHAPGPAFEKSWIQPTDVALADCERLLQTYGHQELLDIWMAPCTITLATPEAFRGVRELADRYGARITAHLSEVPLEVNWAHDHFGCSEMEVLSSTGFLGPDVLAVHCIKVTERDIQIMAEQGVCVSHNPVSNMYLAHGVAPVPRMIEAGITVALATDGAASNNNVDYIEDLKFASLLHKAHTENPLVINASQVLDMATIRAAEAIGKEKELGSLEVGTRADLFICDFSHHISGIPSYDPIATLVYAASSECVRTVMVDGRLVMVDGQVTTIPDYEGTLRGAQAAAFDLVRRAGIL